MEWKVITESNNSLEINMNKEVRNIVTKKPKFINSKGILYIGNHAYQVESFYIKYFLYEAIEDFKKETTLPNEEWVDIVDFPFYQVSSLGRVRRLPSVINIDSIERVTKGKSGIIKSHISAIKGKIVKPQKVGHPDIEGNYRLGVVLSKPGTSKTFLLYRLVAESFIPNPNNLPEVNHKNRDTSDNTVNNLEWVSKQENIDHLHIERKSLIGLYNLSLKEGLSVSAMLNKLMRSYLTIQTDCS